MGDDVISRVEALVTRLESLKVRIASVSVADLRAILSLEHDAFIRGYLACLSDDASPYKEESAKQMAEDAWLDRLPSPPDTGE